MMDNDTGYHGEVITAECAPVSSSQLNGSRHARDCPRAAAATGVSEIAYTDGELRNTCSSFRAGVQVRDHRHRTKIYKSCFIGSDAVDFMMSSRMVSSRLEAVRLGRRMANEYGLFKHVTNDHEFEDGYYFYRFLHTNRQPDRDMGRSSHGQRRVDGLDLSYTEMCLDQDGSVLRREQIREKRIRLGFCPTCPGDPVRLFDIQRSRINPLSRTNQPLTVEGLCLNGQCLLCNPELGPRKKKKKKKKPAVAFVSGLHREDEEYHSSFNESASRISANPQFENSLKNGGTSGSIVSGGDAMPTRTQNTEEEEPNADNETNGFTHVTSNEGVSDDKMNGSSSSFRTMGRYGEDDSSDPMTRPLPSGSRRERNMLGSRHGGGTSENVSENSEDRPSGRRRDGESRNGERRGSSMTDGASYSSGSLGTSENREDTVSELKALIGGLMTGGDSGFVVEVLVNAMKSHPNAVPVQVYCLGSLFELCKNSNASRAENKASIMSSSVPDDILLSMQNLSASTQVQEAACRLLWSLALEKSNRMKLCRAGALGQILSAMKEHKRKVSVVQTAIGALRTVSPEPEIRNVIRDLDGKRTVANAMSVHLSVEEIQRDGIAFLSNISVDIENQHVEVATTEELDAIVCAMAAHPASELVVSGACFALKNYMFEDRNVDILRKSKDVVSLLHNAVEFSEKDECRRNANTVLHFLEMSHAKEQSLEQFRPGMRAGREPPSATIDESLSVLKDENSSNETTTSALQSLLVFTSQSDEHRQRILQERAFCIVQAMNRHPTSANVQEYGCSVFEALAGGGEELRNEIITCGGCGVILNSMQHHVDDISLLCAAFKAIRQLSVQFECWFELETSGGVRKIEELIATHINVASLQEAGTEILTNFSAHNA